MGGLPLHLGLVSLSLFPLFPLVTLAKETDLLTGFGGGAV